MMRGRRTAASPTRGDRGSSSNHSRRSPPRRPPHCLPSLSPSPVRARPPLRRRRPTSSGRTTRQRRSRTPRPPRMRSSRLQHRCRRPRPRLRSVRIRSRERAVRRGRHRRNAVRGIVASVARRSVRARVGARFVRMGARTVGSWSAREGIVGGRIRSVVRGGCSARGNEGFLWTFFFFSSFIRTLLRDGFWSSCSCQCKISGGHPLLVLLTCFVFCITNCL